jgi:hypothetical protein
MPNYWLITNTKFTKNAITYGKCNGLNIVGWNYPSRGNLKDLIEGANLLPITILINLTNHEKRELFNRGIVLCKSLQENRDVLRKIGIIEQRAERVINEISRVLNIVETK